MQIAQVYELMIFDPNLQQSGLVLEKNEKSLHCVKAIS